MMNSNGATFSQLIRGVQSVNRTYYYCKHFNSKKIKTDDITQESWRSYFSGILWF